MVFFYLIHNLPWGSELEDGKRNVRTLFYGSLCYILTHTLLWSSVSGNLRIFRNYLFWILAADFLTMAVIYKMCYGESILREMGWYGKDKSVAESAPINPAQAFQPENTGECSGGGSKEQPFSQPRIEPINRSIQSEDMTQIKGQYCVRKGDGTIECYDDINVPNNPNNMVPPALECGEQARGEQARGEQARGEQVRAEQERGEQEYDEQEYDEQESDEQESDEQEKGREGAQSSVLLLTEDQTGPEGIEEINFPTPGMEMKITEGDGIFGTSDEPEDDVMKILTSMEEEIDIGEPHPSENIRMTEECSNLLI